MMNLARYPERRQIGEGQLYPFTSRGRLNDTIKSNENNYSILSNAA